MGTMIVATLAVALACFQRSQLRRRKIELDRALTKVDLLIKDKAGMQRHVVKCDACMEYLPAKSDGTMHVDLATGHVMGFVCDSCYWRQQARVA